RLARVQQLGAVELSRSADALDLGSQLVDLGLDRGAVGVRERAVLELHGELTDALQHRVDLGQRTLSRLHEADGVMDVALSLLEAVDLTTQTLADREAGGVVSSPVDPVAARE